MHEEIYAKPSTFKQPLRHACTKGDNESKELIEKHAPEMVSTLQKAKEWDN